MSSVSRGLLRTYQLFAYATGVLLVTLTVVSLPSWLERLGAWLADEPSTSETPEWLALLWTAHGWFYMGYLVTAFLIALRLRWTIPRTLLVLLAGTVPGMSFVAERWVVHQSRRGAQGPVPPEHGPAGPGAFEPSESEPSESEPGAAERGASGPGA